MFYMQMMCSSTFYVCVFTVYVLFINDICFNIETIYLFIVIIHTWF